MILCDIGNTFLHFYNHGKVWKEEPHQLSSKDSSEVIIYISVNEESTKSLLYSHPKCFDLTPYLYLDTAYKGLGIDRIASCLAIPNGTIVDAGSAITIDTMHNGIHLGGCILPGIERYRELFSTIDVLDCDFNLSVDLDAFPQNTQDAISYGVLKSIVSMIAQSSKGKKIYFTGGDGKFLSRYFPNSIYDDLLIFKGMQNAISTHITSRGIKL